MSASDKQYLAIIAEPQCTDFEHATVNAALLMALCFAFPGERFLFVAEAIHLEAVRKVIASGEITNLDFAVSPVAERNLSQVRRVFPDFIFLARLFRCALGCRSSLIFLLSVDSSILMGVKLLAKVFPRLPVLVIPHSVLATVVAPSPPRLIDRIFHFRTALKFLGSARVQYLILGQSIFEEICCEMPSLKPACHVMELPYPFPGTDISQSVSELVFAFLGVVHNKKGFDKFIRLAGEMKHVESQKGRVSFLCAGGNPHYDFKLAELEGVDIPFGGKHVPEDDFQRMCRGITYAVLPYARDSYRFYPSSAVFDAFTHCKPIICLRNPYFEHLFDVFGDIGYLCDDYEDLLATVRIITVSFPEDRYRLQQCNILKGREYFSPVTQKDRLHEIVSRLAGLSC